ncbi:MAG: hypothetical protein ACYCW6_23330 [Candidatus Xenobia bacterium]
MPKPRLLTLILVLSLAVGASARGGGHASVGGGSRGGGGWHGSVSRGGGWSRSGGWSHGAPSWSRRAFPIPIGRPSLPAERPFMPPHGVFVAPHPGTVGPLGTVIPTRIVPAPHIVTVPVGVNNFVTSPFAYASPFFFGFSPFFYNPFGFGFGYSPFYCGGFGFGGYYGYGYPYGGYYGSYYPFGEFPGDYADTYGSTYQTIYAPQSSADLETPTGGQPTTIVPETPGTAERQASPSGVEGQIVRLTNKEVVVQTQQGIDRTFTITDQTYVSQILVPGDWVKVSFDPKDGYTPAAQSVVRVNGVR